MQLYPDPYAESMSRINEIYNAARDPFGDRRRAMRKPPFRLGEQERSNLLSEIAGSTMGTLNKFANIINLPGSSVRDILVGENPFDQWAPWNWTTDKYRTTGRDLGRKWGMMKDEDTWGNLFGGLGIDIATDPLTWLTLGMSGASTKIGEVASKAGLTKYLRAAMNFENAARQAGTSALSEAAKQAGKVLPRVGMRESSQLFGLDELLAAVGRKSGEEAMGKATETTLGILKKMGYDSLSQFKDEMAREGIQGLRAGARYGLPRLKMFGHNLLKGTESPGVLLGKAAPLDQLVAAQLGGPVPTTLKAARFFDKTLGRVAETAPIRLGASLLDWTAGGMSTVVGQTYARAASAIGALNQASAREIVTDAMGAIKATLENTAEVGNLHADKLAELTNAHDQLRKLMEFWDSDQISPEAKKISQKIFSYADRLVKRAKEAGAKIDLLDDYGKSIGSPMHYVARQLTATLPTGDIDALKALKYHPLMGSQTSPWNIHFLSRHPLLKDIQGGTAAINEIVKDPQWDVMLKQAKDLKWTDDELRRNVAQWLESKYGMGPGKKNYLDKWYRGPNLNRLEDYPKSYDQSVANRASRVREEILKDTEDQGFLAKIMDDVRLTPEEKNRALRMALDDKWGVVPRADWTGDRITGDMDMWLKKDTRYEDMAAWILKLSNKARRVGVFGNNPLYDVEQYLMKMEDSVLRAQTTMDILMDERAWHNPELKGSVKGLSIGEVLKNLNMDSPEAIRKLMDRYGYDMQQHNYFKCLEWTLEAHVQRDLEQYHRFFKGPEAANKFAMALDTFMAMFKSNVTAPFPAFHFRNLISGQFRNAVAGMFDVKSLWDSFKLMRGGTIHGAKDIPAVQLYHSKLLRTEPAGAIPTTLDDAFASDILRRMARNNDLIGAYGAGKAGVQARNMGSAPFAEPGVHPGERGGYAPVEGQGTMAQLDAELVGNTPYSFADTGKEYLGINKKFKIDPDTGEVMLDEAGKPILERTSSWRGQWFTPSPLLSINAPFTVGRKIIGTAAKKAGSKSERMARWADEKLLWDFQNYAPGKVRGVVTDFDLGTKSMESTLAPVAGGEKFGHWVEGMNRLTPWLNQMRGGMSETAAAMKVGAAQILYQNRGYSPFEQQVLRRIVPFYSFTSRSLPWAVKKFYEEPGNLLNQVIRTQKGIGEQIQSGMPQGGPVPPYIGENMSWPVAGPKSSPGTKRFFTGLDEMSQDLWQLLVPFLSGDIGGGFNALLGSVSPLIKWPIEKVTGVSTWQRGVESGRPLRDMDPVFGRMVSNIVDTWSKITGEEFPERLRDYMEKPTVAEHLLANSPISRYLSTIRTGFDTRKGLMPFLTPTKLTNLLTGFKFHDISPAAQEAMLREYLRYMISAEGGKVFEKATFTDDQLARMAQIDPSMHRRALQLKALNDERAKIAKSLKEQAKLEALGRAPSTWFFSGMA